MAARIPETVSAAMAKHQLAGEQTAAARTALAQAEAAQIEAAAEYRAAASAVEEAAEALADASDDAASHTFHEVSQRKSAVEARLKVVGQRLVSSRSTLAAAESREAAALQLLAYVHAEAETVSAAEELEREYPQIAAALVRILMRLNLAAVQVEQVNADLPEGCKPLRHPEEMVRDRPAAERVIVSEEIVHRWASCATGEPVSSEIEARISTGNGKTGHYSSGGMIVSTHYVELRPFRKVVYLPETPFARGPRLSTLELPGLRVGDRPFWKGDRYLLLPDRVLREAAELSAVESIAPRPLTEWVAV